jgi:hypothetical protein
LASAFPRRRLVACESGDELHVALAHAAEMGRALAVSGALAACISLFSIGLRSHVQPIEFRLVFLACDGLGGDLISCALQLQCFRIFVLLLPSVVRRLTAAVVQIWHSRCILDRKFPSRVLRRIDLPYMCSDPFQPVKHCLKSAHDSLTGLLNSYQFRCDMDSSISNDAP